MNLRKLILPLLVALGCVALAGIPAWAAAPKHHKHEQAPPLRIDSIAVGTKAGPLTLRVRASVHAEVRLRVNGKTVRHPFESVGEQVQQVELSATDGLRAGANHLRLRSTRAGSLRTASRTVDVPRWALLANAGADAGTYVDSGTRLGTQPPLGVGGGKVRYSWSIVDKPKGAQAKLVGHGKAQPLLRASKPGTYVLQLAADPEGNEEPTSYDQVTVPVAADVPPIGLKLETLDGKGGISIGGQSYGSAGATGIAYAIVERTTGAVVKSGGVGTDAGGISALDKLAGEYGAGANYMRYLMILSGNKGVPKSSIDAFAGVMKKLGVALPSAENFLALEVGLPFSIVGVPGAPAGAATTRIPGGYNPPISGSIGGYLQKNQALNAEGTPVYEYVAGENPEFNTRVDGSSATKNVMTVNGQKFEASLPAGATAGLHLVVLESLSLRPIANLALATNGSGGSDRTRQAEAAAKLRAETEKPGGPLVLLQTIGKPKAAGPEWAGIVSQITKLGGNPQLVNALDGSTEYAVVARNGAKSPPAEASTAYDHGPYPAPNYPPASLIGTLARSRTSNFVPNVYSTPTTNRPGGLINIGLMQAAFQAPQEWPELAKGANRDEVAKAEHFICEGLNFCQKVDSCATVRECFWKKYTSDWSVKATKFNEINFVDGKGFGEATFKAVKEELQKETTEVAAVHSFLKALLEPVEQSSGSSYVDLQAIGNKVWESVQRPPADNSTSWILGLIGKAVALGGFAPPPASAAAAGLSAAFGLASYLSNKSGQPILGSEIKVRSSELAKELYGRVQLARETTAGLGMLIVSDYGKLETTYKHLDADWSPPEPARANVALTTAAKQWFYEALIPTAYPYLIRGNGATNARSLNCQGKGFPRQPDMFQMNATTGYDNNGNPITSVFFFTSGVGGGSNPPESLGDEMFRPIGGANPGLGMEKLQFFSARVFNGKIAHAVNNTYACSDGWMPDKS